MKKLLTIFSIFLMLLISSPAFAHSALVRTNPAPNSKIQAGPMTVTLNFSTPFVFLQDTYQAEVQILDPSNKVMSPICSSAETKSLVGVYDFQGYGRYTLNWRAVSEDGHVIGGNYKFTVIKAKTEPRDETFLCEDQGMQVGQVKKPSSQNFDEPFVIETSTALYFILAATLVSAGFVFWSRRRRPLD